MDSYLISLVIIGIASLAMAWMPSVSKKTGISYSIIYVIVGFLIHYFFEDLVFINPLREGATTVHITEMVVIISLMGTGLKIDQRFSFKTWRVPFILVSVTMVFCIAIVAFLSNQFLHFDIASAVLLAAALAPTDPVLASDVQVGPPLEKRKDNIRFSLTAEAGMNDGTAFPFTWLAIILATSTISFESMGNWFLRDVIYRMVAGIACGIAFGKLLSYFIFYLPQKTNFVIIRDGFVAIAATILVYGLTELLQGYGFIAVFVTAITLRNYEMNDKYHKKLHDFTEQIERILVAIVLILFGGTVAHGILNFLTWQMAVFGMAFVFIIRPFTGMISLFKSNLHFKERLAISFFGIRGMGSFFYLSFGLYQADFKYARELWSLVSFIVILSILIHGLTATSVMKKLESEFSKEE
jgi:NhaP-type Na+/H+ or K+/H+ antiporter